MFEETLRELRRLDGQEHSVSIPLDAEDHLDRECPLDQCSFPFKVHGVDWHDCAEALCAKLPAARKARHNAFRSLEEGDDPWHAATGRRYSDHLDPADLAILTCAFRKRHHLAHTQGIVDQRYVDRSGDTSCRPGRRLVIHEPAVRKCADRIEKLASGMARDMQEMA